jgi:hypothetical protein
MSLYAERTYADNYMAAHRLVTDAWDALNNSKKDIALQMATAAMENLDYQGDKTVDTQDLQFPRGGDTTIPIPLQNACCEIAYAFADGVDLEQEYERLRMVSQGFANVRSTYKADPNVLPEHHLNGIPSIIAWRLILPFLRDIGAVTIQRTS